MLQKTYVKDRWINPLEKSVGALNPPIAIFYSPKRAGFFSNEVKSGRKDLNLRHHGPEPCALPDCATPRIKNNKNDLYLKSRDKLYWYDPTLLTLVEKLFSV